MTSIGRGRQRGALPASATVIVLAGTGQSGVEAITLAQITTTGGVIQETFVAQGVSASRPAREDPRLLPAGELTTRFLPESLG